MLAEGLERALGTVTVGAEACSVAVGERELEAEHPQELRRVLSGEIYRRWHVGRDDDDSQPPRTLRDPQLETRLREAMPFRRRIVWAPLLADRDGADELEVRLDGVRVGVPRDRVTDRATSLPSSGTSGHVALQLEAARPALSPGFFFVDGSADSGGHRGGPTLRVYLHLGDSDSAVELWRTVLACLEEAAVPYRAKVTSSGSLFPRRDGLVVYLGSSAWHAVSVIVSAARRIGTSAQETSLFAQRVVPGVAIAWEPEDGRPGNPGSSFGEHRAAALAEGLVTHAVEQPRRRREDVIAAKLREANIDPRAPERNLNSPAVPEISVGTTEMWEVPESV